MLKLNHTMIHRSILLLIILLIPFTGFTQSASIAQGPLLISEILTKGNDSIEDSDEDFPDWIEIFNRSEQTIDLEGWALTDSPNELQQWQFPSTELPAGAYLVVFASGKDRRVPGKELHTNFQLSSDGEFLALTQPDGTISHAYAPGFPNQNQTSRSISYGIQTKSTQLLTTGSTARYLVPENDNLGLTWLEPGFDDSAWSPGNTGLGYGSQDGKFTVTVYLSTTQVSSLSASDRVIENESLQRRVTTAKADVINYFVTGDDGNYGDNQPFPGQSTGQDLDDFVVVAEGTITIPRSGTWTFGLNSDDGGRIRVDGEDVMVDDTTHSPEDHFGSVNLSAGPHEIEALMFERAGGAEMELFAAFGQHNSFDHDTFQLVGDRENGGLALDGFASFINTNVEDELQNQNASLYLRQTFDIPNLTEKTRLQLGMKYNDGFIAYINGTEVARRNAPEIPAWDSAATSTREPGQSSVTVNIPIDIPNSELQSSGNILAIHALNADRNDTDFLIDAELTALDFDPVIARFFFSPTPEGPNGEGISGFLQPPIISLDHGFYDAPVQVSISTPDPGASIRYTTDGSHPTADTGTEYTGPIQIDSTTVLSAATFKEDHAPSANVSRTYLYLDDIIRQTRPEDYPTVWGGGQSADYAMDRDVVFDERYRDTIRDDLKSLPVMSIVTDPENLFDPGKGIYVNPTSKGIAWERPASVELIHPDGSQEGFQINCGLRIQGGFSRLPDRKKHSFRLLFKSNYGPTKLNYPLFENSPVDSFDTITIRGNYNYTWHGQEGGFGINGPKADYMRDEFSRRTQLATGQVASHGTFVHLYLNGIYWGVYNPVERPDASFAAHHYGGEKEEWDTITGGTRGINSTQVKDGNKKAWNTMQNLANRNLALQENYEAIKDYVDIDNLIDYMLTIFYTGNRDAPTVIGGGGRPWNFYTDRWRKPGAGTKFFAWDSEWSLETLDVNVIEFHDGNDDPSHVFQALRANDEFLIQVADRVQKHFFNGGAMTPEASRARYQKMVDTLDRAIVGESARWGDKRGGRARTRDDDWLPEVRRLRDEYLAQRTEIVLNQLREADLFPDLNAPTFNQHGGIVEPGFELTIDSPASIVTETNPMIQIEDQWRYDQSGQDLGSGWRLRSFDDSSWDTGRGLLFVENSDLPAPKNTELTLGQTTYYFRKSIDVTADLLENIESLQINTVIDDGAVIYINGLEVFRTRMPGGDINHDTFANSTVSNADFEGPFTIPADELREGFNVIAVEVHQTNAGSSDIVFGLSMDAVVRQETIKNVPVYFTTDGTDPRLPGGEINIEALLYENPLQLQNSVHIRTRAFDGQSWSALTEATFNVNQSGSIENLLLENLRVTEVMYNPLEGNQFEFIELTNIHPTLSLDLSGVSFVDGIQYTFPDGTILSSGETILAVNAVTPAERQALRDHYNLGGNTTIIGPYVGRLANDGEEIDLVTNEGVRIMQFAYHDGRGWPQAADGAGHSLVPQDHAIPNQEFGSLDYGRNWRASTFRNGSPGAADPVPQPSILINELSAAGTNSEGISNDWIELYNPTGETILLTGMYLSDDEENLRRWPIPEREIAPGAFLSFDEQTGFNNPAGSGFALNLNGETLYLTHWPSNDSLPRVVDAVHFKGQLENHSYSRVPDGSPWFQTSLPSRNEPNNEPVYALRVSEIMYHPPDKGDPPVDNTLDEYIEITNPLDRSVTLENETGPWRIDGGVDYTFPSGTSMAPEEKILILPFDPAGNSALDSFRQHYNISDTTRLFGPYTGRLSNRGERVALEQPISTNEFDEINAWFILDEVIYFDRAPWTINADGTGQSLHRLSFVESGNNPETWQAETPTPGDGSSTQVHHWFIYE